MVSCQWSDVKQSAGALFEEVVGALVMLTTNITRTLTDKLTTDYRLLPNGEGTHGERAEGFHFYRDGEEAEV